MHVQSCVTLCNPIHCSPQAPLSMGFPRQEYWSGLPFLPPKDLPDPGTELMSPALQVDSLPLSHWGRPSRQTKTGKCLFHLITRRALVLVGLPRLPANARDTEDAGSIYGSGGSPGRGNGNPLQYSYLGNSMERGVWQATVHGVAKSQTQLSTEHTGFSGVVRMEVR